MLKQNVHDLNTCASFITKCSDKYGPFICLNCCSNRPYTVITEHIKNSYKAFSYIILMIKGSDNQDPTKCALYRH